MKTRALSLRERRAFASLDSNYCVTITEIGTPAEQAFYAVR